MWVDGVQRIVCGVTEVTTCQEVVIALAQAIGRTGRYTLIEKWRDTERHLAPHENPIISLNKWGQYASDVQLVLRRTGPSLSERPTSDSVARIPERTLYRQSLPPLAKLRPQNDKAIKRREPKRKSLTFTGGAKGLMDIFGKGKESELKQKVLNCKTTIDELKKLIHLQTEKLQSIEKQLDSNNAEIQYWEQRYTYSLEDEIVKLEQKIKRNEVEIKEEEFWENELQIEQENEKQLKEQLQEIQQKILDCESKLKEYVAQIHSMESGLEAEKLHREGQESKVNEEVVREKIDKVRGEIDTQGQQSLRLENSIKAVERSLAQAAKRLQEREQELEQLTKELRQVNLQQFIQQTGTKVTVLPAEPLEPEAVSHTEPEREATFQSGSLKRPSSSRQLPSNLRILQNPLSSGFNPEGIYV